MELVTQEIHNLSINPTQDNFIQDFSKLNLNNLNLENEKNILVGHIFLETKMCLVNDKTKKYFIAVSNYYTEKKKTYLFPLSNKLVLASNKILTDPKKYWTRYLKENYSFTKKNLDNLNIYQVYLQDNVVIYLLNIKNTTKKIKELKITPTLHFYKDPETKFDLKYLYNQIVDTPFNLLNKKFHFFFNNIRVSVKEKRFLEAIN